MRSIDCRSISEFFGKENGLGAGQGGDTGGLTLQLVEQHIRKCPNCHARYGMDLVIAKALRELPQYEPPGVAAFAVSIARRRIIRKQIVNLGAIFVGLFIMGFWLEQNIAEIIKGLARVFADYGGQGFFAFVVQNAVTNGKAIAKVLWLIFTGPMRQFSPPLLNYLMAWMLLGMTVLTIAFMYLFKRLGIVRSVLVEKEVTR